MTEPLERLLSIMARLRDPVHGCEWDRAQDFASIAPYTIEEAYEVADAIERNDMAALRDELGDLLLQVVFHARMAEEAGHFSFADVAAAIAAKLEARHPHIFGEEADSGEHQSDRWERLKASERAERGATSALDGVANSLPALMRAEKLQKRAARVGFDWPDPQGPADKVAEEAAELATAPPDKIAEEAGRAQSVMQSNDQSSMIQAIDDLEAMGDEAKRVCTSSRPSPQVQSVIVRVHDELSNLKHQLH